MIEISTIPKAPPYASVILRFAVVGLTALQYLRVARPILYVLRFNIARLSTCATPSRIHTREQTLYILHAMTDRTGQGEDALLIPTTYHIPASSILCTGRSFCLWWIAWPVSVFYLCLCPSNTTHRFVLQFRRIPTCWHHRQSCSLEGSALCINPSTESKERVYTSHGQRYVARTPCVIVGIPLITVSFQNNYISITHYSVPVLPLRCMEPNQVRLTRGLSRSSI